jgi:hypothetical protein
MRQRRCGCEGPHLQLRYSALLESCSYVLTESRGCCCYWIDMSTPASPHQMHQDEGGRVPRDVKVWRCQGQSRRHGDHYGGNGGWVRCGSNIREGEGEGHGLGGVQAGVTVEGERPAGRVVMPEDVHQGGGHELEGF